MIIQSSIQNAMKLYAFIKEKTEVGAIDNFQFQINTKSQI